MIHVLKQTFFYALGIAVLLLIAHLPTVEAQENDEPEVTYCQDLVTGEIKVVKAGMPCPYPTAEL